jgi:HAD superfamily hydrolase (TIGR01509 family)
MAARALTDFDLIIFDCDGVVVDSEMLSCGCLAEVLRDYGVAIDIETVFREFLGRSFGSVEVYFLQVTGRPLPPDFRGEYRRRLLDRFRQALKPMPGIEALLTGLTVRYCLASSSDEQRLATTLDVTGLGKYFAGRTFHAAMVKAGKPAPDLFTHAAAAMGAAPARCLVVEDTMPGILAGKAAGMTVWAFVGGSHLIGRDAGTAFLGAGADRVFAAMSEFAIPVAANGA